MKRYDVAIIGSGTAGLSARREVAKHTDNYVVIDDGVLGTTCARVGCMPSKVLIQVAEDYHRRHSLDQEGIRGGESLSVDSKEVMSHVRRLRDRFVRAVIADMDSWTETHLIRKRARFISQNTLDLGDEKIEADRIILATGSKPIIPNSWQSIAPFLMDSDKFFEMEELPKSIAVIGLGVIGAELGQAMARLGVRVHGITLNKSIGGVSDPLIQDYVYQTLQKEFPITLHPAESLEKDNGQLLIRAGQNNIQVDMAFAAMGRTPNLSGLGLENLDIPMTDKGVPIFDQNTLQVGQSPLFIAGDVTADRPILHEASDEGRIAGYNAVHSSAQCFRRRTPLGITFTSPNMAFAGEKHHQLKERQADFIVGHVGYEGQGRAIVKLKETGLLHVYAERSTGHILGAEIFAPGGEHLAHLLAWLISLKLTVFEALSLPFYHPVIEEGLRTALRHAASQVEIDQPTLDLIRCQDPPVGCWG